MAFEKVIVFGPTGNIGSITSQTAGKKGAKVYLAMRDPKKTIPGLSQEDEKWANTNDSKLISRTPTPSVLQCKSPVLKRPSYTWHMARQTTC